MLRHVRKIKVKRRNCFVDDQDVSKRPEFIKKCMQCWWLEADLKTQNVFPPFVPALWAKACCSRRRLWPCAPYDRTCCQQKGHVSGRHWQWQVSEPSNQISFEDHMKTKESTNFFLPSLPSRSPYLTLFLSCIPLYILADTLYKGEARRKATIKESQAQGIRRQATIMWLNLKTRMDTITKQTKNQGQTVMFSNTINYISFFLLCLLFIKYSKALLKY